MPLTLQNTYSFFYKWRMTIVIISLIIIIITVIVVLTSKSSNNTDNQIQPPQAPQEAPKEAPKEAPQAPQAPQEPPQPLVSDFIEGFFTKRINVSGGVPFPSANDYIICDIPYTGTLIAIVIKYTLKPNTPNTQLQPNSKFSILWTSFIKNSGANLRDIYVDNNNLPNNKVSVFTTRQDVNEGDIIEIQARDFSVSSTLSDIVVDLYYDKKLESTNYEMNSKAEKRMYYTNKAGFPSRFPDP
jgi:hypothetical protein